MMRGAALLAILVAAGACAQRQEERRDVQQETAAAEPPAPAEPPSPILIRYKPREQGGPGPVPEAEVSGVLDLAGPCVRLQNSRGEMWTLVSTAGPRLGRDFAGLYLDSGRERLRHGSSVKGGGGWFTGLPSIGALERPVPPACAAGPYVVAYGLTRYDPSDEAPPRSPPPPPVG